MNSPNQNGPGSPGASGQGPVGNIDAADIPFRDYAQDAMENFGDVVKRGREMVLRYPVLSVAGAVAAGWLFAKFVARRR